MTKKYKLVIPEMIRKEDDWKSTWLRDKGLDGGVIYDTFKEHKFDFSDIPKEWLEEIKEPKTFDEIIKICRGEDGKPYSAILIDCMVMAVENERLKREAEHPVNTNPCACMTKLKVGHSAFSHTEIYECQQCGDLSTIPF